MTSSYGSMGWRAELACIPPIHILPFSCISSVAWSASKTRRASIDSGCSSWIFKNKSVAMIQKSSVGQKVDGVKREN